jgi:cell division protein ZapA
MPQVSIRIANRTYELACGTGEQERVRELASYVDEKVGELQKQMPTAPEIKLMVFAALLMAEEAREARAAVQDASSAIESASETADTLAELITSRVDKISKKVSGAA